MAHDPLIRRVLPPGVTDLCVGEAHVVRQALLASYDRDLFNACAPVECCDYQEPHGYPLLVAELERRHNKRIVVTAGAKQGLSACFYAMRRLGMVSVNMRAPFWSQMPAAIDIAGMTGFSTYADLPMLAGTGQLLVAPNNPDGHVITPEKAARLCAEAADKRIPFVHDAAYYTPVYVQSDGDLPDLAPTSIYSAAKAYGLSGLRVGWVATSDDAMHQHVCDYVEATTVGVSLPSQMLLYHLLREEACSPEGRLSFITRARMALSTAKELMATVRPDVLDTADCQGTVGMFGWYKRGPRFDADKAMVHVAPGSAFGDATKVRLNLAVDTDVLRGVVGRLNAL